MRLSIEPGRIPGEVNGEVGRTVNRHPGPGAHPDFAVSVSA